MRHSPQTHALIHLVRAHQKVKDEAVSSRFTSDQAVRDMQEDLQRRKELRELKTSVTEVEALLIQLKGRSNASEQITRIEERLSALREEIQSREEKRKIR